MAKQEYEKASCSCGWYVLVLASAKTQVFHCGEQLTKTAGGKEALDE